MYTRANLLMGAVGAILLLAVSIPFVNADIVSLKNGTTVEGSVIKYEGQYRVKTVDGQIRIFSESEVASVTKGSASSAGASPARSGASASLPPSASTSIAGTKARADACDVPILAMTMWEKFIESNPGSADLPAAKEELARWQKLETDHAERINGKWVGGDERRKLMQRVDELCKTARGQLESQTLQAIENYEAALKLYPNCFEANFTLGYFYLTKGATGNRGRGSIPDQDRAIRNLETAARLRPDSAAALSNLAIGYNLRQKYSEAVFIAYKAVKISDSKPIVENLVNCIELAPPGLKSNNAKIKPIMDEASLLAQKYQITAKNLGGFHYILPEPPPPNLPVASGDAPAGIVGNGSGFFISADGYLITNRHVVSDKNRLFRIRMDDGTEKQAEVIAIDPSVDIALMKIRSDAPLPYLKLAPADLPNAGAPCMVLGYPVASLLDYQMQVTSGEVTAASAAEEYQVTLTANTTFGNSGGPIVDRDGNVIGVLSAGTMAPNVTYLKALSSRQIREFLRSLKDKYDQPVEAGKTTTATFDGEKLAEQARKATVMVMIIRGDGRDE